MTKKIYGRHGARWVALQGLYAWQLSGNNITQIEQDILVGKLPLSEEPITKNTKIAFDKGYLHELMHEVVAQVEELDALMAPYLERSLNEMNPIEHSILRIALYELKIRLEIPYRVIINEAILLAKQFGAQEGHKFVNGVLDKVAKQVRPLGDFESSSLKE